MQLNQPLGAGGDLYYYCSVKNDGEAIEALQALAGQYPACGFGKLFALLRRDGKKWNHKKIYRLYRLLKLNKRRKGKRRLLSRAKQPLQPQQETNQSLSTASNQKASTQKKLLQKKALSRKPPPPQQNK